MEARSTSQPAGLTSKPREKKLINQSKVSYMKFCVLKSYFVGKKNQFCIQNMRTNSLKCSPFKFQRISVPELHDIHLKHFDHVIVNLCNDLYFDVIYLRPCTTVLKHEGGKTPYSVKSIPAVLLWVKR